MVKILILGGTAEAGELAARLASDDRLDTVTSLAGLTRMPASIEGSTRRGGFGGPDGLTHFLSDEGYDAVLDATHPFAVQIARHAAEAAAALDLPRIKLVRPLFARQAGDRIHDVGSMKEAASLVPQGSRVFLASGRREIEAFADRPDLWCLVRMIEPPTGINRLPSGEVILGRPPLDPDEEISLMKTHAIEWVVSKDSGGKAWAKIEAARRLGLPIILIRRPPHPHGSIAENVDEICHWLDLTLFSERAGS